MINKLNKYLINIINQYIPSYVIEFTDMPCEIKSNDGLYRKIPNKTKILRNQIFNKDKIYYNDFNCLIKDISLHIYELYLNNNLKKCEIIYNDDDLPVIYRKKDETNGYLFLKINYHSCFNFEILIYKKFETYGKFSSLKIYHGKFIFDIKHIDVLTFNLHIFTDCSVNQKHKISIGSFLFLDHLRENVQDLIQYKEYKSSRSTWSEIQTVIEALKLCSTKSITLYTDCQSVCDLLGRRREKIDSLIKNNKLIKNIEHYKEFYKITDQFNITVIKIKAHSKIITLEDKIFSYVDKASRKKLKSIVKSLT